MAERTLKNRLKEDNGASMILILVLIAFLAILLSVLMTNTMLNYRMKIALAHARNNFYSAEQEMEMERREIAETVSDVLAKSYSSVMTSGISFEEETLVNAFRTSFQEGLKTALARKAPGKEIEVLPDRIVVKDFSVTKTDAEGYTSSIRTDIAVLIPDAAYWKEHGVMEVKDLVVYENFTEN